VVSSCSTIRWSSHLIAAWILFVLAGSIGNAQEIQSGPLLVETEPWGSEVTVQWAPPEETAVPRFRKHFFQGAELRGGHLFDFGGGSNAIDQSYEEARFAVGVPLFDMDNLLAARPYFRIDHLHGPVQRSPGDLDVPETLYDTGVSIFNRKKWTEKLSTILLLTPSVRSDFTTSDEAFRLFGLGVVSWKVRRDLEVMLGAVYLDRADLGILPVVGATWTPTPEWKLELTLPRPRLSRRMWKQGALAEAWVYLGGEFAGNTWAVSRASGTTDELSLGGVDVFLGYEWIRAGNRGLVAETGFRFARELEYERSGEEFDLDDGVFLRGGWQF